VVQEIKELGSELEIAATVFLEGEVFEQRDVPIVAAGAAHTVMRFVAPGPRSWHGENRSIEPIFQDTVKVRRKN
jgi:hypothetical protein